MDTSNKAVQELRNQFLSKLQCVDPDQFHPADIDRVKIDDNYLKRFLLHHDGNQENAFNMMWETCEWRKKFGANDITDKSLNPGLIELASVYSSGKDRDGKTLLVFKSKRHVKGAFDFEDHKKFLVYWMERLERQENGDMISLFFDMEGAVLANMDLEYTKYIIGLFKNYYPHFLNYIIIFEMAWVLSAVFKVIKTLLPPKAIEKMKFVGKSNVKDYIDSETAPKPVGGKDLFSSLEADKKGASFSTTSSGDDVKKKVHFAEQEQTNESGFEDSSILASVSNCTGLSVSPSDVMTFTPDGSEVTSLIVLKNEDLKCFSYKIKTTSPEKFRVRPSAGVLASGASATISVVLLPGYLSQTLQRDKFLIMSIPIEHSDISPQEINDLWKQTSDKDVHQHRLRCTVPQITSYDSGLKNNCSYTTQSTDDQKIISKMCSDVAKLNTCAYDLKEEIKSIKRQQWILLFAVFVLLCSFTYSLYYKDSDCHSLKRNCWTDGRR